MRAYAAVFVSVLLAELGDKTQLATLLFASAAGTWIGARLTPGHVRVAAAVGFIAIGVWMLARG